MVNIVFSGIYAFLFLLVVAVLIAVWTNYKRDKKNLLFLLQCVVVLGWLLVDFAVLHIGNINLNIFFWNLNLAFLAFSPVLLFIISFRNFLPGVKLPAACKVILIGIPTITTLITITANFHSLFRIVDTLVVWPRATEYSFGPWFMVHAPFSFGVAVASIAVVVYGLVKKTASNRNAAVLFIVALAAVMAGTLTYMTEILPVDINPTSIGAAVAMVAVHMALYEGDYSVFFRMFNTLKSRITFPVLGAVFAMMITVTLLVATSTNRLVEHFEDDRMTATVQAVRAYITSLERQTFMTASAMGSSAELIRLIDAYNAGQVPREAI